MGEARRAVGPESHPRRRRGAGGWGGGPGGEGRDGEAAGAVGVEEQKRRLLKILCYTFVGVSFLTAIAVNFLP